MSGEGRVEGDHPIRTAAAVAEGIRDDATLLVSGFGSVGYPKAVPLALAESGRDLALTVVSGGNVGEEIDVALAEAGAIARRFPYQAASGLRAAINEGRVAYHDRGVGGLADEVLFGGLVDPDVAVVEAVAVGPDWLVPSTSLGQTPAFVEAADRLVVEVNHAQPRELAAVHDIYRPGPPPDRAPVPLSGPGDRIGGPRISFDPAALVAVVETDRPDSPYTFRDPTDADRAIAAGFRRFLEAELERSAVYDDSVRLQFGVGSLGNALMGALGEVDLGGRRLQYFGEVVQDGLLELIDEGRLAVASGTSLALSAAGQQRLFADLERYAETIVLRPTDVSNDPGVINRFGVVAVNSALEVDLAGHANATHVDGSDVLTGIGGGGDFNQNALVAVCALPSRLDDGRSRVVPAVPHVDHTEHDIDVVITEQGVADLRGRSPRERAEAIVESCAHPDVRPDLRAYLERARAAGGHIPRDPDTVWDWRA